MIFSCRLSGDITRKAYFNRLCIAIQPFEVSGIELVISRNREQDIL